MSDFFYELAAKNLGTANIVVPRPPALFESTTEQTQFESASEPESIRTFDDVNVVESRPARRPRWRSESLEETVFPPGEADLPSSSSSIRTFQEAENKPSSQTIPGTAVDDARRHKPGQDLSRAFPGEDSRLVHQPKIDGLTGEPKLRLFPLPQISAPTERREREGDRTAEAKTQIIAKPRVAVTRDREGSRPHAAYDNATKFIGEQPEKREPPVINITIGRVEVRALPSPAPSRAAKTEPPGVSLDEFLQRRRNGGAR